MCFQRKIVVNEILQEIFQAVVAEPATARRHWRSPAQLLNLQRRGPVGRLQDRETPHGRWPPPFFGLATAYEEQTGSGAALLHKNYTWSQDGAGNVYIGAVATTLDPGQSYAATTKTEQTAAATRIT